MSELVLTAELNSSDVSPAEFRNAMRQLAGGISVITVGDGERRSGLTVTSVSSLSAEPPIVIFCISRGSSSWPILTTSRTFAVNVLAPEHIDIAERFSGKRGEKGAERYADATWSKLVTGAPVLSDAIAVLDCVVDEFIERHGSAIVVGRVQSAIIRPEPDIDEPLTYWRGTYGTTRKRSDPV
ncbi:flavin reductase family protein [Hyphomicrobium sp.]|jgi:flavin reductase (DIM6/NTAB) family NADH-FMN oxidoreductase RutF|uniref:flavin reductase family protein n=1 Tax=Hyphomicrobium sp. TaxID=82 RepID=UPI002B80BF6A|nr:flavin reductase family protein [Hyphomicrobium sp.]HVZ03975.1 flavin reductase family protein [Hyphomicrobium sp.]